MAYMGKNKTKKALLEKVIGQLSLDLKEAREFIDVGDNSSAYREAVMYYKGIEHAVQYLCDLYHAL